MPHIQCTHFEHFETPVKHNDVEFNFFAKNMNLDEEELVGCKIDDKEFVLQIKTKGDRFVIKCNKVTRISPNFYIHKALEAFIELSKAKVVFSNLPSKEVFHLEHANETLKKIEFFANNFPTDKQLAIEVGFGSGRHLLHQAKKNPNLLFIGLEIHKPSIEQVVKQVKLQKIENLLVVDYDARLFLELVPSNLVKHIFVHFPVPWDKRPHRRIISKEFITEARRALCVEGTLELRTDSDNYFNYSLAEFLSFKHLDIQVKKNFSLDVSSKYEDRWLRMEKDIYDITMTNYEDSEPLALEANFDFDSIYLSTEQILSLYKQTHRFESTFIHFEKLYKKTNGEHLILCSLGSFSRPEHLFIACSDTLEYYPSQPVHSKSNLLAHTNIKEILNG